MSLTYGYNVTFLEQTDYYLSDNKTGLLGYPDVLPLTLNDFRTMITEKYNTTFASIAIPPVIYVCLLTLGLTSNLVNIAIFTRPCMKAPLNFLLACLESANIVLYIGYIPELVATAFYPDERLEYHWNLVFNITRVIVTASMFISNWINVTIGLFRYIAVTWPLKAGNWCNSTKAKLSVIVIGLASVPVATVLYCLNVATPYAIAVYQDAYSDTPLFFKTLCTSDSIIDFDEESSRFKLESVLMLLSTSIPCLISALFTLLLIGNLCVAKKRRRRLSENRNQNSVIKMETRKENSANDVKKAKTDVETRLTITLLVVLVISNLSYLPTSLLYVALLTDDRTILNSGIYNASESGIGVILSNCLMFFVYVTMSQRFRKNVGWSCL